MNYELIRAVLIHVATVGQVLFVLMWMTLPWWKAWVGRALMVKSLALAVFLISSLAHFYLPPYAAQEAVRTLLVFAVTGGIWSQVVAIGVEIRKAKAGKRNVTGTDDLEKGVIVSKG